MGKADIEGGWTIMEQELKEELFKLRSEIVKMHNDIIYIQHSMTKISKQLSKLSETNPEEKNVETIFGVNTKIEKL
jgi:hypothetical protein